MEKFNARTTVACSGPTLNFSDRNIFMGTFLECATNSFAKHYTRSGKSHEGTLQSQQGAENEAIDWITSDCGRAHHGDYVRAGR